MMLSHISRDGLPQDEVGDAAEHFREFFVRLVGNHKVSGIIKFLANAGFVVYTIFCDHS